MLEIFSNDPQMATVEILLSGTGIIAYPAITVDPTQITFDTTLVNQTSVELLNINNTGLATLIVTGIISTNDVFSVDLTSFNVAPGTSQVVQVTFAPDEQMLFEGVLQIESNDPAGIFEVALSGYGDIETSVNPNQLSEILVYPNPVTDVLTIANVQDNEVCIYDLIGNLMFRCISSSDKLQINISGFHGGFYLLQVSGRASVVTRKIEVNN
jgi:hypothetical protein